MNNITKIQTAKAAVSWVITLWICKVFLSSLPYKFTNHPDTAHIFGTIGEWMKGILGISIGEWFAVGGAYIVGSFELLTSIVLLLPALLWVIAKIVPGGPSDGDTRSERMRHCMRARLHGIGGLAAAAVMSGAVFFHLFTPLGVEVLHQGKSDGGSLFYAAVSIVVLGIALFAINTIRTKGEQ